MSNFVDDNTSLAFPKKTLVAVPVGKEIYYLRAADWNAVCQAAYDLRTALAGKLSSANNSVTLAHLADITSARILGRATAGTGDPELLTGTQVTALLDPFTSVLKGLVPASGGGTANFLRADGTWAQVDTSIPVFDAKKYGAVGDGLVDDSASIRLAIAAAAAAGGGIVYFPKGTYLISKDGSNAWCIDIGGSNVTLMGVPGASTIKAAAGMPGSSVAILRINEKNNVTLYGLTVDGNWGNASTTIAAASNNVALPAATINVLDTTGFPASGTTVVETTAGLQSVTYTGKTATSFTGCSGGTGTMVGGNSYLFRGGVVGYVNANTGINHTTQGDPKNYGAFVRGSSNVHIDNCIFQQIYGDAIWFGQGATDFSKWTEFATVTRTRINMCARSGIAAAQKARKLTVDKCYIDNVYSGAQSFDTEPVGIGASVRDVTIKDTFFGGWWGRADPSFDTNIALSITSGYSSATSELDAGRNFRVSDCTFHGAIYIFNAIDIDIERCRVVCDWNGKSYAPISISGTSDDIRIRDCYVYARTQTGTGATAGIAVSYYAVGANTYHPSNVLVKNNIIHARNGNAGIIVNGTGGIEFDSVVVPGETNTATGIADTVVTRTGAAWTENQWVGYRVKMGSAYGVIVSNTVNTFTVTAWSTPLGNAALTPAAGAYEIFSGGGLVDLDGNQIDCTNDGNGQGGVGIKVIADRAGVRVRIRRNIIKNALASAIDIDATNRSVESVEINGNHAWNNEISSTTAQHIKFTVPSNIQKLILGGNTQGDGVAVAVSGLTSGKWLEEDGEMQHWAGWGSPNGVIAAKVGSLYRRRDDGAAAAMWLKQTNEDANTGWVRLTQPNRQKWTIDQGSGIGVPANSTEWTNLISEAGLAISNPDALWLCQESSGNLVDSMAGTYPLTAGGANAYQRTISAWERKAVGQNDNVQGFFESTDATLPDMSAGAITLVMFAMIGTNPTPNATRAMAILGTGAGTNQISYLGGAASTRVTSGANIVTGTGTNWGSVQPYVLRHNQPGSATHGMDRTQKLAPTFSSLVTGKRIALGGMTSIIAPPTTYFLYAFMWKSAIADADLKALLQQMGWTINWT